MRIAVFHELSPGGARRVANEFSSHLKKKHTVDLFYVDTKDDKKEHSLYSSTHFSRFVPKVWSGGNWKAKLYKDTVELVRLYFFHKKISKKINNGKYDFAIIHPSKLTQAPFILRFIKTKKIYYAHEIYRIMYEPVFRFRKSEYPMKYIYETATKFIKKIIDKRSTSFADVILTNSKHTKEGFKKFYNRTGIVCYPGVACSYFKPGEIAKDIDILFIGSLDYETDEYTLFKNTLNFVSRKVTIKVLGGGDNWVSDQELLNYYRRAKIVLCTARFEPLGLVPLEAGACGTPAVAVNEAGYKETIIHNKTGLLVRRNPTLIASTLERILRNKAQLNRLGMNAQKQVVENWGWEKRTEALEKILMGLKKKMIRNALRNSANQVLSAFGLSIVRNYEREYLEGKYHDLLYETQSFFKEKIFKDFIPDKERTKLLAQLYGTQVSEALYMIYFLKKTLQLRGDVCEFGCANGATSVLLAHEIKKTDKKLWLFDSFQGLSKPLKEDELINDIFHLGSMSKYEGSMRYSVEEVKKRLRTVKFPKGRTKIVPGYIEHTITQKNLPKEISFAFVDFDLYMPIKIALEYLDNHLVNGGFVLVDDYNFFSLGAKKAVDDFYTRHKRKYKLSFPYKSAGHFCILEKK